MVWKFANESIYKHVYEEDDSVNGLIFKSIMLVFVEQALAFSRFAK